MWKSILWHCGNVGIKGNKQVGYIVADNIITSISYNFVKWGLAFGKMHKVFAKVNGFLYQKYEEKIVSENTYKKRGTDIIMKDYKYEVLL